MTLPGGAAAKLGLRYERWWTLSELVRMLRGDAESLRIEPPGMDGVEFVVKVGNGRHEHHQAKRSHPSGKWSMATLASSGVLATIGKLLIGSPHRFVFVSGSDARELADLCEAAVGAESLDEFTAQFLGAKRRAAAHERLLAAWRCDRETAWDVLRRIDVHTINERQLADKVRLGLSTLVHGPLDPLCDLLAARVDNEVHGTIERGGLVNQLREAGFLLRKVSSPDAARQAVVDATDNYLAGVRRGLIQDSLLPRAKTAEVVARLTGEQPAACVLTGAAGVGKTACVLEAVDQLRTKGVHVLAFRLDRHMAATTVADLGKRLDLEESPALVLSAAAKADGAGAVLVIDQLDAVSAASGRDSNAFDVVAQLLNEAKDTAVGALVVCRVFDWHHDPRLRGLIREDDKRVELNTLSADDVRGVLAKAGHEANALSNRQFDLLCLPQNLSLFLNADLQPSTGFSSVGDLFGSYWTEKRRLVVWGAGGEHDQWIALIRTMCDDMNKTQQLAVRKERLDQVTPGYLERCVSEGVLVVEGDSYAFHHESFFDYCFARLFVSKGESLTSVLTSSEQHLFRRAQVRQVLDYLREGEPDRYAKELRALVFGDRIRAHIKSLAFALLARLEEPSDAEWGIWREAVQPIVDAIDRDAGGCNALADYAWNEIFHARTWFRQFHERGLIDDFLSGNARHTELAVSYLRRHQRNWPDDVAAYLERFVGQGGEGRRRLRTILLHPVFGACRSRRYFELVLRLVDDGTLDTEGGGRPAKLYRDIGTANREWIPELLSRQLRRWCVVAAGQSASTPVARRFDWLKDLPTKALEETAEGASGAFVEHVLPAVLEVADTAAYVESGLPRRDAVWPPVLIKGSSSGTDACLDALSDALGRLAGQGEDMRNWITTLLERRTHVANHLLLAIYRGGGPRYADEAAAEFCANPWRFRCGYSGHRYWCATEAVKTIVPHCGVEVRAALEGTILAYQDPFEQTKDGVRSRGEAAYNLLSAFPEELHTKEATRKYQEMRRKFYRPWAAPRDIEVGWVGSPIPSDAAIKMDDDQWLRALATYSGETPISDRSWPLQGGAPQLASTLEKGVTDAPDRFAALFHRLPRDTNPVYVSAWLRGLEKATIDDDAKIAVCQRAFEYARTECGRDVADVLATAVAPLPEHALDLLRWLATETEDREAEDQWNVDAGNGQFYFGGDIEENGINTTRGRAALAIGKLILEDDRYIPRLASTLNDLVSVRSAAVGSCVAFVFRAVAVHDAELGLDLFLRMDFSEERLLGTRHVWEFMRENVVREFTRLKEMIARMARSPHPDVSRDGASLACLAAFFEDEARGLADEVRRGNRHQRLGSAEVAAANVGEHRYRERCEDALAAFFVDDDPEVRNVAASCFRHIAEQELADFDALVKAFCSSKAYDHDAHSLLLALKKARAPLPTMTLLACEALLDTGSRTFDLWTASELVFRVYQQHQNDEWTTPALDLIDRLCLEAPTEASRGLDDFDR